MNLVHLLATKFIDYLKLSDCCNEKSYPSRSSKMYDLGVSTFCGESVSKNCRTTRTVSARGHYLAFNWATPKTKSEAEVLNRIDLFHAIDRLSIMDEVEKRLRHPLDCMLEINVSGEESKHGFTPEEALDAYRASKQYEDSYCWFDDSNHLFISDEEIRAFFRVAHKLLNSIPRRKKG